MLLVDAHLDLGMNALAWDRDLMLEVATIRAQEIGVPGKGRTLGTVSLPEMRRGRVAFCVTTTVARSTGKPVAGIDFRSAAQAHGSAQGQVAYYRALETLGQARVITEPGVLAELVSAWTDWDRGDGEGDAPPLGFVLSMESADPVLSPDDLEEWYKLGIRLIGPAHFGPGRYAGGTGVEDGLTELGRGLLREMERVGIALDVTHLSDHAFWEALDLYGGPVIASHNNCRTLVHHQRQLDDAQLKALIERDAVIGGALDIWMLEPGWQQGQSTNRDVLLERVCDHIDHISQLAGDARHSGMGTDLDGGFGREEAPEDLDTIADLQKLDALLHARGYSDADVAAILHGNWLRTFERILTRD